MQLSVLSMGNEQEQFSERNRTVLPQTVLFCPQRRHFDPRGHVLVISERTEEKMQPSLWPFSKNQ